MPTPGKKFKSESLSQESEASDTSTANGSPKRDLGEDRVPALPPSDGLAKLAHVPATKDGKGNEEASSAAEAEAASVDKEADGNEEGLGGDSGGDESKRSDDEPPTKKRGTLRIYRNFLPGPKRELFLFI